MKRIKKTVKHACMGLVLGYILFVLAGEPVDSSIALCFMGFPSGWRFINKHIGNFRMLAGMPLQIIGFCLQAFFCYTFGWIVLCLDLLLCLIEYCSGKEIV